MVLRRIDEADMTVSVAQQPAGTNLVSGLEIVLLPDISLTIRHSAGPHSEATSSARLAAGSIPRRHVWAMLFSRTVLFALWQSVFALGFRLAGSTRPWAASVPWWLLTASLGNITNIGLLAWMARREGFRLSQIFNFERKTWKGDVLLVIAATAVAAPLGYFPNPLLARALFGSPSVVIPMMFQPLPEWAIVVAAVVFPVTIALSELPNYVLPRLKTLTGSGWQIVMLVGLSHALQHVTLPLLFDARFMLWRFGMFLPFALFVACLVNWRPSLLPYLMLVHGLLDASLATLVPAA